MKENQLADEKSDRSWMTVSLAIAILLLFLKLFAYKITGSTAILSDAVESMVHLAAVIFAFYSLRISQRPADKDHPYGHAKISFFSSSFEGLMIALAALFIAWKAVVALLDRSPVQHLQEGMWLSIIVLVVNLALGVCLLRSSKRTGSVILRANGFHILTDAWTSAGVWVALLLVQLTGWLYWDPIVGILIAINILITGIQLMVKGFHGLMDRADPNTESLLVNSLDTECGKWSIQYHRLKFRDIGGTLDIDVDLLFPDEMPIKQAHEIATHVERALAKSIKGKAIISTHLEPIRHHAEIHPKTKT